MQNTAKYRQAKWRKAETQRNNNRRCDKNHKSDETVNVHALCAGCENDITCANYNKEGVVRTGHTRSDGNYDCYKFNKSMYCPCN